MTNWKKALALLLALAMLLALAACGGSDGAETKKDSETTVTGSDAGATTPADKTPDDGGAADAGSSDGGSKSRAIIIGDTNAPVTFEPTGMMQVYWQKMVFDVLVDTDLDGNLVPGIATSWEYEDELTLVMHLRDDVFCTGGEQITASDCLWSLRFWATNTSMASNFACYDLDNSYCEDDYTLVIKFARPFGPGLGVMGNVWMWDEEWASNASPEDWWGNPNGSGPFVVSENVDGSHITFTRKDSYFGDLPEVETLTYKYYSELSTMFIDLENGAIDIAVNIQENDAERLMSNPDEHPELAYEKRDMIDNMNLFLCDYVEYFQDDNVRKAIFLALDGDEVATGVYGSIFKHADSVMPASLPYHIECSIPEQNIEEARRLMAESAYPDGFELRFVATTGQDLAATVIQAQLAQIGITVNVETYDPGTAIPMMMAGEVDLCLRTGMGGSPIIDPYVAINSTYAYGSPLRAVMQDNAEFNEYFETATYSVDTAVRQSAYDWLQNWLIDECHVYPICERCAVVAWNTNTVASCRSLGGSYISGRYIELA